MIDWRYHLRGTHDYESSELVKRRILSAEGNTHCDYGGNLSCSIQFRNGRNNLRDLQRDGGGLQLDQILQCPQTIWTWTIPTSQHFLLHDSFKMPALYHEYLQYPEHDPSSAPKSSISNELEKYQEPSPQPSRHCPSTPNTPSSYPRAPLQLYICTILHQRLIRPLILS
jgi:hypothetical protein